MKSSDEKKSFFIYKARVARVLVSRWLIPGWRSVRSLRIPSGLRLLLLWRIHWHPLRWISGLLGWVALLRWILLLPLTLIGVVITRLASHWLLNYNSLLCWLLCWLIALAALFAEEAAAHAEQQIAQAVAHV
jgi:hypothetical protein